MSIPDELRNLRDHLRSGSFGQREVWEQQLEQAAVGFERLTSERNDYEAEGRRHIKTIAELRHEKERLYIDVAERDKKLARWQHDALGWSDRLTEATDEVERLQGEIDTCRELREYDRIEIVRLNKVNSVLCNCYADIKTEMDRLIELLAKAKGEPV